VPQVCPTLYPCSGLESTAKKILEDIAEGGENVVKAPKTLKSCSLKTLMTELVVYLPLLRVAEDLVRLCRLLEPLLSLFIARIAVRMVFKGQMPITFFYFSIRGVSTYTEDLIIVSLLHYDLSLFFSEFCTKGFMLA